MPRLMQSNSRSSLSTIKPMPAIQEDESGVPPIPAKSRLRRSPLRTGYAPSYGSYGSPPPPYCRVDAPDRRPGAVRPGFREQAWLARRGGWRRVAFVGAAVVLAVVGLAAGLAAGLRRHDNKHHDAAADGGSPPDPRATLFPAGPYAFTAALTNVSTGCTASPSAWRCYPYRTYASASPPSSTAAATTFFWIIAVGHDSGSSSGSDPGSAADGDNAAPPAAYRISSSEDPFAPSFVDLPLAVLDDGTEAERLAFSFRLNKTLAPPPPPAAAAAAGAATVRTCAFPGTRMAATLWTRRRAEYPADIAAVATPAGAGPAAGFAPWPFAVEISQVQEPGPGVPECRDGEGRLVAGLEAGRDGGVCTCWYANVDLDDRVSVTG